MRMLRVGLALLPFVGILAGVFFVNRVEPFVLGLPFLLFWMVAWTVIAALLMALVYRLDPRNRREETPHPNPVSSTGQALLPQGEKEQEGPN